MANSSAVAGEAGSRVIDVDDERFDEEVLAADIPVLVDFGARWCAPCRALAPIVERFATENAGWVKVVKVDSDEAPQTVRRYGVRAVPMVLVFRNGKKTAAHLGMASKEKLQELLER
jgi:thioredoxin 1